MTGGGLRAATLRRHARLLSVGEQYLHDDVGTDTVQRCQRGRRTGGRVLRTSLSQRPGSDFGDVVPLSCPAACLADQKTNRPPTPFLACLCRVPMSARKAMRHWVGWGERLRPSFGWLPYDVWATLRFLEGDMACRPAFRAAQGGLFPRRDAARAPR
jgi:hypothetical protein